LSCEPLLTPVSIRDYLPRGDSGPLVDWVICGGESGPGARPMQIDWARSLRNQCQQAGVAFFMKQMGGLRKPFAPIPDDLMIREFPNG
jgi:protein gp37